MWRGVLVDRAGGMAVVGDARLAFRLSWDVLAKFRFEGLACISG